MSAQDIELEEATTFARGGRRTRALRTTAGAAHRTSRETTPTAAHPAAVAAGDAAASAYLHPLAEATQVGHILRATAHAALALPHGTGAAIDDLSGLADDHLRAVPARHPRASPGTTEVGHLVHHLDEVLRA